MQSHPVKFRSQTWEVTVCDTHCYAVRAHKNDRKIVFAKTPEDLAHALCMAFEPKVTCMKKETWEVSETGNVTKLES